MLYILIFITFSGYVLLIGTGVQQTIPLINCIAITSDSGESVSLKSLSDLWNLSGA